MSDPRIPTPAGLGPRGSEYWAGVVDRYSMSPTEAEVLREACSTLDALDQCAAMIAEDGPRVTGAAGQIKVHPAIGQAASLRITLHRLLAALALPDDSGNSVGTSISTRGRTAANARWSRHESRQAN